jgi:hypothetical protein
MKKLVIALVALTLLLSSCTVSISYWIPEPVPTIHYRQVYSGHITGGYDRSLVLDFENMTYQIAGSSPTHMSYRDDGVLVFGSGGSYYLYVESHTYSSISGFWSFGSSLPRPGENRFYAGRRLTN